MEYITGSKVGLDIIESDQLRKWIAYVILCTSDTKNKTDCAAEKTDLICGRDVTSHQKSYSTKHIFQCDYQDIPQHTDGERPAFPQEPGFSS